MSVDLLLPILYPSTLNCNLSQSRIEYQFPPNVYTEIQKSNQLSGSSLSLWANVQRQEVLDLAKTHVVDIQDKELQAALLLRIVKEEIKINLDTAKATVRLIQNPQIEIYALYEIFQAEAEKDPVLAKKNLLTQNSDLLHNKQPVKNDLFLQEKVNLLKPIMGTEFSILSLFARINQQDLTNIQVLIAEAKEDPTSAKQRVGAMLQKEPLSDTQPKLDTKEDELQILSAVKIACALAKTHPVDAIDFAKLIEDSFFRDITLLLLIHVENIDLDYAKQAAAHIKHPHDRELSFLKIVEKEIVIDAQAAQQTSKNIGFYPSYIEECDLMIQMTKMQSLRQRYIQEAKKACSNNDNQGRLLYLIVLDEIYYDIQTARQTAKLINCPILKNKALKAICLAQATSDIEAAVSTIKNLPTEEQDKVMVAMLAVAAQHNTDIAIDCAQNKLKEPMQSQALAEICLAQAKNDLKRALTTLNHINDPYHYCSTLVAIVEQAPPPKNLTNLLYFS